LFLKQVKMFKTVHKIFQKRKTSGTNFYSISIVLILLSGFLFQQTVINSVAKTSNRISTKKPDELPRSKADEVSLRESSSVIHSSPLQVFDPEGSDRRADGVFWIKNKKIVLQPTPTLVSITPGQTLLKKTGKKEVPSKPDPTTKATPTINLQPTPTLVSITPSLTPTPTATPQRPSAQNINLTNWKLTLPTGEAGHPTEIKQPALSSYQIDPWFIILSEGIRFRAPVNGVTTSGSGYPRSELREMSNNGTAKASWSSTSGTHTMFLDEAITAVPQTKKHVVAGQIHDASDDVLVVRLEYPNLYVNVDGKNLFTLDSSYSLGERFTVKFEVENGQTKVYYNGGQSPVYVLDKSYSGAYFKTGAYAQSNCSREGSTLCNSDNFGEVIIYQATVTHQ